MIDQTRSRQRAGLSRAGLSLVELLAVLMILAILAMLIIPRLSTSSATAKTSVHQQNLAEINSAVGRWWVEKGTWPADDLSDIAADQSFFPDGLPKNPVTGTNYSLDATSHRAQ